MGDYHIYLSFNNLQEIIELPVLPEKLEISQGGSNKTYDLLNTGEINVIKGLKLPELDIEGYFPADRTHVTSGKFFEPMHYVQTIQKWASTLRPIRLTMTGTINLNWPVSIESFTYSEEGGTVGEIQYKLGLKQYVFYGPAKVEIVDGSGTTIKSERPAGRTVPATITVRQNEDTFWIIAKKYLGDGNLAAGIALLNGMKPGDVLFPEDQIRLR